MPLLDALSLLNRLDQTFAVVKRGQREIGMIGLSRIRSFLEQTNKEYAEEQKTEEFDHLHDKYQSWKNKLSGNKFDANKLSGSFAGPFGNVSRESSGIQNRISKDEFGQEISGISKKVEKSEFDSNEDAATLSEYIMSYNKDDSIVRTELSNRVVTNDYDDKTVESKDDQNRLAKSERVKKTTKNVTIQNYLNNRRSVKIQFSKKHPLKQSLLGSSAGTAAGAYDDTIDELDDSLLADLENPLEP